MPISILMPALSPTMTDGKLAKWVVNEGDTVEAGDVIAEIETDKATMEVEAVDEGRIARIIVPAGTDNVPVNGMIAVLLEEDEDDTSVDDFITNGVSSVSLAVVEDVKEDKPSVAPKAEAVVEKSSVSAVSNTGKRVFASPLARRLAGDRGIDLSQMTGSGPHGRIVKSDVLNFSGTVSAPAIATSATASLPTSTGPDARALAEMLNIPHHLEENSGMRKVIAKRLLESKQTVPHYYLSVDCDLDKLLAIRKEMNDGADGLFKLSVNDFIVKASAMALKKIPESNVSWTDNAMVIYDRVDVSIAVATPGGLITPIVKDADNKSLSQISAEVKDLATRARDGLLKPEEYQGGTFSLSNLGMFGVKSFNAIINPPQACILAVGAGELRPVVKNGEIVPATIMTATASLDHRAIDGAVGAQFLGAFKSFIENPLSVLA